MNHRIIYRDPDTGVDYALLFKDNDPANVRITAPPQAGGVLIPFCALEYLMSVYRLHVFYDHFEHRPVQRKR